MVELASRRSPSARVKSYSVPSTAAWPVGRPRSSECSTARPGAVRTTESTVAVPSVRYGMCAGTRTGTASGPTFVAVVATESPSSESAYSMRDGERRTGIRAADESGAPARRGWAPARRVVHADQRTSPWIAFRGSGSLSGSWWPAPFELVRAVLDPIRPRQQHLAPARGAHLVGSVAVEQLATACGVRAEPAADLDDDRPLVAVDELELLAGRSARGGPAQAVAASRLAPIRSSR